ncbi:hypothetical protein D9M71_420320 [compost metagenome]
MTLEIAGDAADGVHRVAPDVDVAVTVEIHGEGAEAARHELRQAHGAGVGTLEHQRIDLLLAGQQEELLELLAEEVGTRRVVEAQGREGVDDAEVAGVAAVEGLDANDRHYHLGRHAVLFLGAGQGIGMLVPEVHAFLDARRRDEDRPVFLPGPDPLGGAGDGIENGLFALHLAEQVHQLLAGETIVAGHLGDELGHLRRSLVIPRQRRHGCPQQSDQGSPGDPQPHPSAQCFQIFHSLQTWAIHLR